MFWYIVCIVCSKKELSDKDIHLSINRMLNEKSSIIIREDSIALPKGKVLGDSTMLFFTKTNCLLQ